MFVRVIRGVFVLDASSSQFVLRRWTIDLKAVHQAFFQQRLACGRAISMPEARSSQPRLHAHQIVWSAFLIDLSPHSALLRRHQYSPQAELHGGFTLIELVIAVLVLVVGVLGLAGTSAAVARMSGDGARRGTAAEMAQSRFEAFRSAGCAIPVGAGAYTARGVRESWNVTPRGNGLFDVVDSISLPTGTGRSLYAYRSLILC
ncbi:MAG: prepilin-type N-terminal cleavage/methylation domain-containing protein [Gemmatimonadaceae bacterium]